MPLFVDWARDVLENILQAIPSSENPALIKGIRSKFRDDFSGGTLNADNWEVIQLGSGQAITVSNSELQINTGTSTGSTIIRSKKSFSIPVRLSFVFYLSQRIANQNFIIEIVDSAGENYARWSFNGTNPNNSIPSVANFGIAGSAIAVNTANATSTYALYEIDIGLNEVIFATRNLEAGNARASSYSRNRKIPDPNLEYFIQVRVENSGVVSNTTVFVDSFSYQIPELLSAEITGGRGSTVGSEAIPVIGVGGNFSINGAIAVSTIGTITALDNVVYSTETIATLLANATFTGASKDTAGRKNLTVFVNSDQTGTLFVDWSADALTFFPFPGQACAANTSVVYQQETPLRYYRIRFVNGATAATPKIYTLLRFL
ncbi:hypothetical protein [Calothrix sp. PCC 6303]|uniref:hypothetical protein n=1 Tax=Calothrix sp. PCC 6303 TaxID=1170562 RepID=UPI0002A03594|nr:hypothetical protein [Calothrix sp. PCC 6303]AFZ01626.1 hypothetical protein Cal6303_2653 [Calothrix sp. PCC 6303]